MTTPDDKADVREFWIVLNSISAGPYNSGKLEYVAFNFNPGRTEMPVIHVVEASALRAAEERIAEETIRADGNCDAFTEANRRAFEAQQKRDEALQRYRAIELANAAMTRNDHATFGELLTKVATQEREIAELKAENLELLSVAGQEHITRALAQSEKRSLRAELDAALAELREMKARAK